MPNDIVLATLRDAPRPMSIWFWTPREGTNTAGGTLLDGIVAPKDGKFNRRPGFDSRVTSRTRFLLKFCTTRIHLIFNFTSMFAREILE